MADVLDVDGVSVYQRKNQTKSEDTGRQEGEPPEDLDCTVIVYRVLELYNMR